MTITAYLFDYTLNVICDGNKSECARKLGIRRTDLNRMEHRFEDGASSVRAIEAILLLFWRENHSLDQVLKGYFESNPDTLPQHTPQRHPEDMIRSLRTEMAQEWQQAGTRMRLFKSAETFMAQIEHSFCSKECQMLRVCETECPCKKFAEYVVWLRAEMERSFISTMKPKQE